MCHWFILFSFPRQLSEWLGATDPTRLRAHWAGCAAIKSEDHWYHRNSVFFQRSQFQVSRSNVYQENKTNKSAAGLPVCAVANKATCFCSRAECLMWVVRGQRGRSGSIVSKAWPVSSSLLLWAPMTWSWWRMMKWYDKLNYILDIL